MFQLSAAQLLTPAGGRGWSWEDCDATWCDMDMEGSRKRATCLPWLHMTPMLKWPKPFSQVRAKFGSFLVRIRASVKEAQTSNACCYNILSKSSESWHAVEHDLAHHHCCRTSLQRTGLFVSSLSGGPNEGSHGKNGQGSWTEKNRSQHGHNSSALPWQQFISLEYWLHWWMPWRFWVRLLTLLHSARSAGFQLAGDLGWGHHDIIWHLNHPKGFLLWDSAWFLSQVLRMTTTKWQPDPAKIASRSICLRRKLHLEDGGNPQIVELAQRASWLT